MGLLDGLGFGSLGLGLAGDIFSAYSNWQAQKRQREMFDQMRAYSQRMQDPNYIASQVNALYQPLQGQALDQVNRMMNANLALRGLSGGGGYANLESARALAEQDLQRRQMAMQAYMNSSGQGLQALQGAAGSVGQPYGQMGGTAGALQSLMLMQGLNRNQQQPTTQTQSVSGSFSPNWNEPNTAFTTFDPTYNYGV